MGWDRHRGPGQRKRAERAKARKTGSRSKEKSAWRLECAKQHLGLGCRLLPTTGKERTVVRSAGLGAETHKPTLAV